MYTKGKDWKPPYTDKRPATTADLLKLFPREDRKALQAVLDNNLLKAALAWNKQQLQYMDALGWHTTDLKQKLLTAVFAYGFMKGQQAATNNK